MTAVLLMHYFQIPNPDPFNPTNTCSDPPLGCWDGYNKPGTFRKAVDSDVNTYIRPGVIIPKGTRNCYKSIYFNLDGTTFYIASLLFFWFAFTFKGLENITFAVIEGNANWIAIFTYLSSVPTGWHAFSVLIHFLNDRFFDIYSRQLYYTITVIYSLLILMYNVANFECSDLVYQKLRGKALMVSAGISLSHIIQIATYKSVYDMHHLTGHFMRVIIVLSDVMNLLCFLKMISEIKGVGLWRMIYARILMVCVGNIAVCFLLACK
jgi:hypothetical protein